MNLETEFKKWLDTNPRKEIRDCELVRISNKHTLDFAIGFTEWVIETENKPKGEFTMTELLEIYKKTL